MDGISLNEKCMNTDRIAATPDRSSTVLSSFRKGGAEHLTQAKRCDVPRRSTARRLQICAGESRSANRTSWSAQELMNSSESAANGSLHVPSTSEVDYQEQVEARTDTILSSSCYVIALGRNRRAFSAFSPQTRRLACRKFSVVTESLRCDRYGRRQLVSSRRLQQ